jgi:hypothetical protein
VTFKEMLMANSIQADAVCQLLIEKGVFTEEEFHAKAYLLRKSFTLNWAKWSMNIGRSKKGKLCSESRPHFLKEVQQRWTQKNI